VAVGVAGLGRVHLRFQLTEIEGARPEAGEDSALEAEASRHEYAEELARGSTEAHEILYGGDDSVADRLAAVRRMVERLADRDPSLGAEAEALEDVFHRVAEIGRRLGDYASAVDHDPVRLEQVRERLDRLFRLKRKYGPELADVLATAHRVRSELADLDEADHDLAELEARIATVGRALIARARELSDRRQQAAGRLGEEVSRILPELGLVEGTFSVRLTPYEEVSSGGAEGVEFLVAPNQGFEPQPIARIASGGELSRVMLALKAVLASVDHVPVLVFDEIDAGVGGVVGTAVARKLEDVARNHQVFVVSHLAQVASRARAHLLVEKTQGARITSTAVRELEGEARVEEIARMLGGDPGSETSRRHARELLGR